VRTKEGKYFCSIVPVGASHEAVESLKNKSITGHEADGIVVEQCATVGNLICMTGKLRDLQIEPVVAAMVSVITNIHTWIWRVQFMKKGGLTSIQPPRTLVSLAPPTPPRPSSCHWLLVNHQRGGGEDAHLNGLTRTSTWRRGSFSALCTPVASNEEIVARHDCACCAELSLKMVVHLRHGSVQTTQGRKDRLVRPGAR
jgi:hypothetical protein